MLRERETLQNAVQFAKEQAFAKAGEISIVRANQLKTQRDHERQLKEVHKQHSEIAARQQAEIEHARAEHEKLVTEKKYLQHDLIEESERARQLQRIAKSGTGSNTISTRDKSRNIAATPKKNVALPFRDGFNDDEIMAVSPSKTQGRSKATTPKAGEKRKRKVVEPSPAQSLQFSQPKDEITQKASTPRKPQDGAAKGTRFTPKSDYQFQVRVVLQESMKILIVGSIPRKSSIIELGLAKVGHSKSLPNLLSLRHQKFICPLCF